MFFQFIIYLYLIALVDALPFWGNFNDIEIAENTDDSECAVFYEVSTSPRYHVEVRRAALKMLQNCFHQKVAQRYAAHKGVQRRFRKHHRSIRPSGPARIRF